MAPVIKQKTKKSSKQELPVTDKETVVSSQLQKKINKQPVKKEDRGVVFIKHLPHGFFEQQLKNYFEQFGKVTRLRLARSKRTGNSKGYAFVEFEYPEVAQVAAETMDNYLMFKKLVKAAYIPPEKQQYNYFRSTVRQIKNKSGKTVWVSSKTASVQRKMKEHNDWSGENFTKRTNKQLKKLQKMAKKCAHLGIDINKIIIEPKVQSENDEAAGSSKTSKRKSEKEAKTDGKKGKKQPKLEDLLGNTIQEDSEDEDYIAMAGDDDNEQSSDEESYGFLKEDDDDEDDSDNEEEESEEEEEQKPVKGKKSKTNFSKSLKNSNIERFDQMLKRKPHAGGIQKPNKKLTKPATVSNPKNKMQLYAAKEIAQPLSKVQGKKAKNSGNALKKSKKVK
ncbi:MKI67 FHA domain-interacting nucleolar phosphoprotein [Musca domestica]|uniref:MKI67 FHA domain-interacting nucleolar phosphoprotein n=1 Tax=Musca domestica TaxID=7370 RepID=A0A9J7I5N9_MUSDO|nr:MKI67 FHA domain-interacting nucleolar phosphoprotein [Musca domestica]